MPRDRTRYCQPPQRQRTPTPTPTPIPTPTPTPSHPRLNQKLIYGVLFILLSLLVLLLLIKTLPSRTPWPAYQPLPSAATWIEQPTLHSTPRAPHKAIQITLTTISTLVTELNRSLTTTCPGCVWRTASGEVCVRTFYGDGDVSLFTCVALFIVFCWVFGMMEFLDGIADIAPPFRKRVLICGIGGAVVAAACMVACVVFRGVRDEWYWCPFFGLGAVFAGMLLGLFLTREEVVVKWREEMKAEEARFEYAEGEAR